MEGHKSKSMGRLRPHLKIWQKPKKSDRLNGIISDLLRRRTELYEIDDSIIEKFTEFPLSEPTLKGLKLCSFSKPTAVQKKSLKHSLAGKDVVVEAKTGSGKTLAFVIPILECIYTERISALDGPIAVILTPTRELARQIVSVFHRVGKFHIFTILDIMGGKNRMDKRQEWQRAAKANILIGTPGRFAQHQQENPTLDISNLRILVLDEVDRLLDPTFIHDLLCITDNLTKDRQCLLFSATLSKTREQLSCLNLKSPVMISTNAASLAATPVHLIQSYSIVTLDKKLDYLWTFLQSHCKKKVIVFFSTQKQVRFVHDLFLQMRPYFSLMQLRGNMLQSKRFKIYEKFSQTPKGAVLLATNVAERGLDFPEVHWVVQFDCPKQLDDYIHRVGRTARAERIGRAITFLLPSEVKLVELLAQRNVVLRQQQFPESRIQPVVTDRAPSLLVSQPELAKSARSAFTAYLRDYCYVPKQSASMTPNLKSVFQPSQLPIDEFAASLGLPLTPEVPKSMNQFLDSHRSGEMGENRVSEKTPSIWPAADNECDSDTDGLLKRKTFSVLRPELKAKVEAIGRKVLEVSSSEEMDDDDDEASSSGAEESKDQDFFETKKPAAEIPATLSRATKKKPSRTRIQRAKRELKRNIRSHSKLEFDDTGKPLAKTIGGVPVTDLGIHHDVLPPPRLDIEAERERLRTLVDVDDKARWRTRIREKHRQERKKAKESRKQQSEEGNPPQLLSDEDNSDTNGERVNDAFSDSHNDIDSDFDNPLTPPNKRQRKC